MKNKIINRLKEYFIKENISFEYKLNMIFFFLSFLLSLVSAIFDAIFSGMDWGIIVRFVYALFAVAYFFLPLKTRNILLRPLLTTINFIYLPLLYFSASVSLRTLLLFAMIGLFMVAILFKGLKRVTAILFNIAIYIAFAVFEYFLHGTSTPFQNEFIQLFDIIVSIVLVFAGFSFIAAFVSDSFLKEQKFIKSLVNELEIKNEELSDLSIRDALTGVYNKRYLTEYINNELEVCRKNNSQFFVLMLDLDFFKNINDKYGHTAGDVVLIEFVKTVQANIRIKDVLSRFGGEEFVVILKMNNKELAVEIAERIRKSVEALIFKEGFSVTVSIGISKSEISDTYESVVERADALMYSAKNNGRNRVAI